MIYKVYGHVLSRTFRVLWMLEELGVPYEHFPTPPHSGEVLALSKAGKVPVFVEGEAVLTDSTAILTYLADKHGQLTFPAGTLDRARQDALTHAILDEVEAPLWLATRHAKLLPDERRVPQVLPALQEDFSAGVGRIADGFAGPYLTGDRMTVADIILTHCLNWAYSAKFVHDQENLLEYAKAMRGREAFKRAAAK